VRRNVSVRVVVGRVSPHKYPETRSGHGVPARTSTSLGKTRVGLVVGLNDRKIGREPLSTRGGPVVPPLAERSISSQQYESVSPFGSLPEPVRAKGVRAGME
jgi:hypothetical protein